MRLSLSIVVSIRQQYTDPARPVCLLRACADWPSERRANTCDEIPSPQGASLLRPMIATYHTWKEKPANSALLMSHTGQPPRLNDLDVSASPRLRTCGS